MRPDVSRVFTSLISSLDGRPVCYLSTPITSGLRELELTASLGAADVRDLRTRFPSRWRRDVLEANEHAARQCAARLRAALPDRQVLNPADTEQPGWSQDSYDELWAAVLQKIRPVIAPAPGWAYSRGARKEIALALLTGLSFVSLDGEPIDSSAIRAEWTQADSAIATQHWDAFMAPLPSAPPIMRPATRQAPGSARTQYATTAASLLTFRHA